MAHLYVAAARKSSGKTTVSVGLAAALANRGLVVQPFKKGPDYIDPLWLRRAAGRDCYNLDFFTMSEAEIVALFAAKSAAADISLIEGNKGLFDGLDVEGTDSNAALATLLSAPVVLVIDTTGMTRGIAPLVSGYLSFDSTVDIRGVILNNVGGPRHEGKLRAALERYTDTEVLGAIGRDRSLRIPERHLGLIPANEARQADAMIQQLAAAVTADVDVDRILEIAATGKMPAADVPTVTEVTRAAPDIRIAIARDAAFGFYYPDDLDAFANAGAVLVPFDTLADQELPEADALFIGGGFPETHLTALAGNQDLLADIRQKLAAGMPAYAECGGLMYLARSIQWGDVKGDMVGAIAGDIVVGDRPQGRGYAVLEETGLGSWPTVPGSIHVHEFHYSQLQNLSGNMDFCYRVLRGHGIDGQHDGLVVGNLLASFTHQRNTASNQWVERFLTFIRTAREDKD